VRSSPSVPPPTLPVAPVSTVPVLQPARRVESRHEDYDATLAPHDVALMQRLSSDLYLSSDVRRSATMAWPEGHSRGSIAGSSPAGARGLYGDGGVMGDGRRHEVPHVARDSGASGGGGGGGIGVTGSGVGVSSGGARGWSDSFPASARSTAVAVDRSLHSVTTVTAALAAHRSAEPVRVPRRPDDVDLGGSRIGVRSSAAELCRCGVRPRQSGSDLCARCMTDTVQRPLSAGRSRPSPRASPPPEAHSLHRGAPVCSWFQLCEE
jgi:hypothetical protein